MSGPCGDIGDGWIGASGRDVDFAVALVDEFEEEFLFDAIDGAAVGGHGREGGGGGDHAVEDEAIFEAEGGGDGFFAFDGEDANFAGRILWFVGGWRVGSSGGELGECNGEESGGEGCGGGREELAAGAAVVAVVAGRGCCAGCVCWLVGRFGGTRHLRGAPCLAPAAF